MVMGLNICTFLQTQPILRMCTLGPYLGVIGAWADGMENNKTMEEKPTKDT